jgi:HicB family
VSAVRQSEETEHSGRLLLRMPRTLHGQLAQAAEREGVSLNRLIVTRLSRSISAGAASSTVHGGEDATVAQPRQSPLLRYALLINFVVLLVTGVAAVVLLVTAYR